MDDFDLIDAFDHIDRFDEPIETQFHEYMDSLSEFEFKQLYRLKKDTFLRLSLSLNLPQKTKGHAYSSNFDILMLLAYLANQSFMNIAGKLLNISKTSAHRAIHLVIDHLVALHDEKIKFPHDTSTIKHKFLLKSSFPDFIGAIDCTHVKIQSPGRATGERFRNRKGYFSINVQAVCDTDLRFLDVVVQWPGRVHDSRIFANSRLKLRLETNQLHGRLFGDAGYALTQYLITPYPVQNATAEQRRFNRVHSSARMAIEKAFGVLKRRFPALKTEIRLVDPVEICKLIHSAFILHNICLENADNIDEELNANFDEPDADNQIQNLNQAGQQVRDELCRLLQN